MDRFLVHPVPYQLSRKIGRQRTALCAHSIQDADALLMGREAHEWSAFQCSGTNACYVINYPVGELQPFFERLLCLFPE